jgi:hypothetical protein
MMKIKKNGYWNIKLIYDYQKNSMMSNALEVETLSQALAVYGAMETFARDKTDTFTLTDVLSKDEEYKAPTELPW